MPAPHDGGLITTAYSDKCSEHGYLVQTVRETRDTQLSEVAEARAWRGMTTDKLHGLAAALQAHIERHAERAEITAETEALQERRDARSRAWAAWGVKALVAIAGAAAALGVKLAFWG